MKSKLISKSNFKETEIGKIPLEWEVKPIDDLYEIRSGLSKPRHEFGFGYPFLTFKEILENSSLPDELHNLANSTENERRNCSIKRGDVFLTRTSETWEELGMSSVSLGDYENATFNGFAKRLRPKDKERILPEFAIYLFRSYIVQTQFSKYNSLTTRASLNASAIKETLLLIPTILEQFKISKILLNLDNKIKNLNNQNKVLEQTAQTIFKSRFVDFDGQTEFVDSELGKIPKGWIFKKLSNKISVTYGFPFKSKLFNSNLGTPLIRIRNLPDNYSDTFTNESCNNKFLVSAGDILAGMDGEFNTHIWLGEDSLLNQRVCKFVGKDSEISNIFIYFSLRKKIKEFEKKKVGTTVIHLSRPDIEDLLILVPDDQSIIKFNEITRPIFNELIKNEKMKRNLQKIKDSLFPKLISGEIRV